MGGGCLICDSGLLVNVGPSAPHRGAGRGGGGEMSAGAKLVMPGVQTQSPDPGAFFYSACWMSVLLLVISMSR